jgi:hypothetical protein
MTYQHTVDASTSPEAATTGALMRFVLTARGLFNYLRNRYRHDGNEQRLPDGSARITFPVGTTLEVPGEVLTLSRRPGIRRGAQAVITGSSISSRPKH